ncbi:hypothetical protein HPB50_017931 [Hyalomma asiaticum]|uniref:Uncharacterized protein n=1 Tax=Hyalomma asiaticum TaxID=266040 RepID=A0ACB7T3C6_HYAAI|nr:hypothetical protein HPB50_017931 [Hyalomma asiaticum]
MESAAATAPEEGVLRRHLRDLRKCGNTLTGYADCREVYEELLRDLAAVNVCFQTEHSVKPKGRLMFSTQRGHVVINEDMPFKVVQTTDRGCLFGRDLHKVQDSRSRQEKDADWSAATFQRKKVKLQGTKKKGCTATLHVKQVELYPEFKVNIPQQCTKWQHEISSKEVLSRLRPPVVAKHIVERLTRASDYRSDDVEVGSEEGTFRVRSVSQGCGFHEVNFSAPSCKNCSVNQDE